MTQIKTTPLPKVLFFTAEPMLALEAQALHLSYNHEFNILCKRQFSELKNVLENYFYEVLFLDLSHLNDPLGILTQINKISPATLIFLIDTTTGISTADLSKFLNKSRIYRILPRPFNFATYVEEVKQAAQNARCYHKSLYTTTNVPMILTEELPNVILLHPDFAFGAKVKRSCEEIAQVSWAANLSDLALLLDRYEPWAIITAPAIEAGDCLRACYAIHKKYPDICFGMVTNGDNKESIIAGINHFALLHADDEQALLADSESFLSPLLDGYENGICQDWQKIFRSSTKFPDGEIDPQTADFLTHLDDLSESEW